MKKYEKLARFIEDGAAHPEHNEAAKMLRELGMVYETAHELVYAKTHEHSKHAYVKMINLVKEKQHVSQ